jgi:hypothetical protein
VGHLGALLAFCIAGLVAVYLCFLVCLFDLFVLFYIVKRQVSSSNSWMAPREGRNSDANAAQFFFFSFFVRRAEASCTLGIQGRKSL